MNVYLFLHLKSKTVNHTEQDVNAPLARLISGIFGSGTRLLEMGDDLGDDWWEHDDNAGI